MEKISFLDFNVNATGTLNLLELTKKSKVLHSFLCQLIKFMEIILIDLTFTKSTRWELKSDKNYKGIKEKFSIDNTTHSFFGVSKAC